MTETEFRAARWIAAQTSRRGEAFAVIVALSAVFGSGGVHGARLAELLEVKRANISAATRDLEALGILEKKWSISESARSEHGRYHEIRLVKNWTNIVAAAKREADLNDLSGDSK